MCWAGYVPILSRPSRVAVRGSEKAASDSVTATCTRPALGPPEATLSHTELGRSQKRHTLPQGLKRPHFTRSPPARACGPGRTRAPGTACARPAPGEEPPGSGPLSRGCCGPPASRSCGLSFPGAPALSAFFSPRALPTASPCPPSRLGLHAGRPDRGTGECHSPPRSEALPGPRG